MHEPKSVIEDETLISLGFKETNRLANPSQITRCSDNWKKKKWLNSGLCHPSRSLIETQRKRRKKQVR